MDIDSYQPTETCSEPVSPIPGGFVSIYIPDDEETAFVGWESEFASIPLRQKPSQLRSCFESIVTEPQSKIITNNGKEVAKAFLSCGLPACEIIDVVIAEKLIANGEVEYRCVNLKTVFKRYGFPEGLERSMTVHRLMDVWEKQEKLLGSSGLETIFNLEKRSIWVTAKIESAGIGIDVDALLEYHDALTNKLKSLAAMQGNIIPEGISLNDRLKIKAHLNSAYSLSLAEINEDSVKTISNVDVRNLLDNLLEY